MSGKASYKPGYEITKVGVREVREAFRILATDGNPVGNTELFKALDLVFDREKTIARNALRDLRKQGEIRRVDRGVHIPVNLKPQIPSVRERIFRAMHIKGVFTARDISIRTDAERSYVRATIRKLIRDGWLESAGSTKGPTGQSEQVLRVRQPDRFYTEIVKGGKYEPPNRKRRKKTVAE